MRNIELLKQINLMFGLMNILLGALHSMKWKKTKTKKKENKMRINIEVEYQTLKK